MTTHAKAGESGSGGKATSRPWDARVSVDADGDIQDSQGTKLAEVFYPQFAQELVEAVNSHAALEQRVAALESALEECLDALDELATNGPEAYRDCAPSTRASARRLLRPQGGEEGA